MTNPGQFEIQVRFFGAFRKFGNGQNISVTLPSASTVSDLKGVLSKTLKAGDLVQKSAFADETRVLRDDELLQGKSTISVLPPVCGG